MSELAPYLKFIQTLHRKYCLKPSILRFHSTPLSIPEISNRSFMAAKKVMKGKKTAKARNLHRGKKLEAQKSLKKGAPVPYLTYTMTQTQ